MASGRVLRLLGGPEVVGFGPDDDSLASDDGCLCCYTRSRRAFPRARRACAFSDGL